jgi:putative ABC transport system permease protein
LSYPSDADVWWPRELEPDTSGRTAHNVRVLARLKPGVSLGAAQAEMTLIARRLDATYGADHDSTDASVIPLHERTVGGSRPLLLILLGGVAIVLLATCANVANMVLARGTGRRRELAVRQALGAERRQLLRLLLTENLVLGAAGAIGGLSTAAGFVRALVAIAPASIPRLDQVHIDARAALAATALALITPIVFGWVPSLNLSRGSLRDVLAEGGRLGTRGSGRAGQGLVAIEMAIALLLVISAGLLARSLVRLLDVDPGFQPARVLTLQTTVPEGKYSDAAAAARLYEAWLDRVAAVPGVESSGIVNAPPLSGFDANGGFMLDGQVWDDVRDNWVAQSAVYRIASDSYFDAIGIPLRRGRLFDGRDVPGAEPAVLINEALARRHFANRDPIGQRLRFAGMDDVRSSDLAAEPVPEVFVNFRQQPMRTRYFMTTAVRLASGAGAAATVPLLRDAWRTLDPDVPVEVSRMTTLVERSTAARRFTLTVIGLFGAIALVLAGIGVYGILSHVVADRTREIGIRMALGASPGSVTRLVFASAAVAVSAGVAGGVAAAVGVTRFLQSFLFEISPMDATTMSGGIGVLLAVSVVAAWHPVRRASRIAPAVVMRED